MLVPDSERGPLRAASRDWPSWTLTERQLCDLELLMNGGFSPLDGFLSRADYDAVCSNMRLSNGALWPIPVVLDVDGAAAATFAGRSHVALRDAEGVMLAALEVAEIWQPDLIKEASEVYGTGNPEHAGVRYLLEQTNPVYVGGRVLGLELPRHAGYRDLRHTPAELRSMFASHGWTTVVAFQTRNPLHRAHVELTRRAVNPGGHLLIHPVVGQTKSGDVDHHTRIRCYRAVLKQYPAGMATLSLLPLSMRMAGPREAVWHARIRKNYGCSHFIVGRDHAGPGADASGRPFYEPYDAQTLLKTFEREIGIAIVPFREMLYVPALDRYLFDDEIPSDTRTATISGTDLRDRLSGGREIPAWFTFPEVAAELRRSYPDRAHQGYVVFLTGLSGSGKSTIAEVLLAKLLECDRRRVTLLDGDIVRRHLSSELGFSKADRDRNVRRIGYVASEVAKHGGAAVCAAIAPYDEARQEARRLVESGGGGFVLVHLTTPLDVCEARDRKGLYAKARAGLVAGFTGLTDPYEAPGDATIVIDTTETRSADAADQIVAYLAERGYLGDCTNILV